MFKTRTIVALMSLVAVGGFAAYLLTRKDPNVRDPGAGGGVSAAVWPLAGEKTGKVTEIDEVEIAEPGKPKLVLKKDASGWMLVEPVADRADQKSVDAAIAALADLRITDVIAESKESYDKVQVKDEDLTRIVAKKQGTTMATLLLGRGMNVRVPDDARVYATSGLRRGSLLRDVKMWRDREILRFDREKLDRLEFSLEGGKRISVKREAPPAEPPPEPGPDGKTPPPKPKPPDKWLLVEGADLVGGPLDESIVTAIVPTLMRLDANDFADGVTDAAAGLTPPRVSVTVVTTDGGKKTVEIGTIEGEDAYVKVAGGSRIWKIRKVTAENLNKPPLQWRDKTLAKVAPGDLTKIEFVKGADKTVLEHDGTAWKITAPAGAEFDPTRLTQAASGFSNLRAAAILEGAPPADAGFDKPTGSVTLHKKEGGTIAITLGALKDKSYFVKVSGRNEVFTVAEFLGGRLLKTPADFKKVEKPPGAQGMPGMVPGM